MWTIAATVRTKAPTSALTYAIGSFRSLCELCLWEKGFIFRTLNIRIISKLSVNLKINEFGRLELIKRISEWMGIISNVCPIYNIKVYLTLFCIYIYLVTVTSRVIETLLHSCRIIISAILSFTK